MTLSPSSDQPAQDLHWMQWAYRLSVEAFERGDWPTGAVLVKQGALLATGQNRQVSRGSFLIHAETDAIAAAHRQHGQDACQGSTLYCTMEPCPMCAGALKLAGVNRIVVSLRHAKLRRADLGEYCLERFFALTGWQAQLESGLLEDEYLALRRRWGRDAVKESQEAAAGLAGEPGVGGCVRQGPANHGQPLRHTPEGERSHAGEYEAEIERA